MTTSRPVSMISPKLDTALVGGLSVIVLGLLVAISAFTPKQYILKEFAVLTVLINGTHFLASYRILYRSKALAMQYPWASIYIPALLVAYSVLALSALTWSPPVYDLVTGLLLINALYLAVHYTGQAWGMMCSYGFLENIKFDSLERKLFRASLKILMIWQMIWSLTLVPFLAPEENAIVKYLMYSISGVAIITLPIGIWLFRRVAKHSTHFPSLNVTLPYFSLHAWYLVLFFYPQALFWIQISHALQYLPFPARVEMNQTLDMAESDRRRRLWTYVLVLCGASFVVFYGVHWGINYPNGGREAYWVVIASIISIHHYFIDGCIWKISNPGVREGLFKHVKLA